MDDPDNTFYNRGHVHKRPRAGAGDDDPWDETEQPRPKRERLGDVLLARLGLQTGNQTVELDMGNVPKATAAAAAAVAGQDPLPPLEKRYPREDGILVSRDDRNKRLNTYPLDDAYRSTWFQLEDLMRKNPDYKAVVKLAGFIGMEPTQLVLEENMVRIERLERELKETLKAAREKASMTMNERAGAISSISARLSQYTDRLEVLKKIVETIRPTVLRWYWMLTTTGFRPIATPQDASMFWDGTTSLPIPYWLYGDKVRVDYDVAFSTQIGVNVPTAETIKEDRTYWTWTSFAKPLYEEMEKKFAEKTLSMTARHVLFGDYLVLRDYVLCHFVGLLPDPVLCAADKPHSGRSLPQRLKDIATLLAERSDPLKQPLSILTNDKGTRDIAPDAVGRYEKEKDTLYETAVTLADSLRRKMAAKNVAEQVFKDDRDERLQTYFGILDKLFLASESMDNRMYPSFARLFFWQGYLQEKYMDTVGKAYVQAQVAQCFPFDDANGSLRMTIKEKSNPNFRASMMHAILFPALGTDGIDVTEVRVATDKLVFLVASNADGNNKATVVVDIPNSAEREAWTTFVTGLYNPPDDKWSRACRTLLCYCGWLTFLGDSERFTTFLGLLASGVTTANGAGAVREKGNEFLGDPVDALAKLHHQTMRASGREIRAVHAYYALREITRSTILVSKYDQESMEAIVKQLNQQYDNKQGAIAVMLGGQDYKDTPEYKRELREARAKLYPSLFQEDWLTVYSTRMADLGWKPEAVTRLAENTDPAMEWWTKRLFSAEGNESRLFSHPSYESLAFNQGLLDNETRSTLSAQVSSTLRRFMAGDDGNADIAARYNISMLRVLLVMAIFLGHSYPRMQETLTKHVETTRRDLLTADEKLSAALAGDPTRDVADVFTLMDRFYTPSRAWEMQTLLTGRMTLISPVVAAISAAYNDVQIHMPQFRNVPCDVLTGYTTAPVRAGGARPDPSARDYADESISDPGAVDGLSTAFLQLVAAYVLQQRLGFPDQYKTQKQHEMAPVVVMRHIATLRQYTVTPVGNRAWRVARVPLPPPSRSSSLGMTGGGGGGGGWQSVTFVYGRR